MGDTVRLQVSDANGLSGTVAETVHVASQALVLMQPFPIVRIAGSETFSGVDLRLLTAEAPAGSRITVTCKGRACPAKSGDSGGAALRPQYIKTHRVHSP